MMMLTESGPHLPRLRWIIGPDAEKTSGGTLPDHL